MENSSRTNRCGRLLADQIMSMAELTLITPQNLGTRINTSTGEASTIDLLFTNANLVLNVLTTTGPDLGSDHLVVDSTLGSAPKRSPSRIAKWVFEESNWPNWNTAIEEELLTKTITSR